MEVGILPGEYKTWLHGKVRFFTLLQVVKILKGEDAVLEWKQNSLSGRALLLDACDLEDYSCAAYLNDLNRHMELALE